MKIMNTKFFCVVVAVLSLLLLSGCANKVYNPDWTTNGKPIWIDPVVAAPAPAPEPAPAPAPEPAPLSVAEQNSRATGAFNDLGFEAEETEQGVLVYLPPSIYFASSGSDINLDARAKIAEIANEVNKDYLMAREIQVSGHTDSVGAPDANLATSKRRAEAATSELVFSKVRLTRIKTTWFGETQLRMEERDANGKVIPENRALNRRVEFTILNPS